MRKTTEVWAKFESIGKPESKKIVQGTILEVLKTQAEWLLGVYMGTHIDIRIARSEADLYRGRKGESQNDLLQNDLDAMFNEIMSQADQVEVDS